jgi:hypothetical protein
MAEGSLIATTITATANNTSAGATATSLALAKNLSLPDWLALCVQLGRVDNAVKCWIGRMDYVVALIREWQTLIAGLLGVVAGIIAYIGAIKAARRQVAVLTDQIEDMRTARRQADERRLSAIKWAIRAEGRRLDVAIVALRRAMPSRPQPANRIREQLVIKSSPLLRGEREDISLLDDQTRTRLEAVVVYLDEYNALIETAVAGDQGPLIEQKTLDVLDRLAAAVREIDSVL